MFHHELRCLTPYRRVYDKEADENREDRKARGWDSFDDDEERSLLDTQAYDHGVEFGLGSEPENTIVHEIWQLLTLGLPVSLATLCRLLLFAMEAAFVASLGPLFLAAMAVAQVWQSILLTGIYGAAVAINELCSMGYVSDEAGTPGKYLQLGLLTMLLLSPMVTFGYLQTETVLSRILGVCANVDHAACDLSPNGLSLSHPPPAGCVCAYGGAYSLASAATVVPHALQSAVKQYLVAQELVLPVTIVSVVALPANYLLNTVSGIAAPPMYA